MIDPGAFGIEFRRGIPVPAVRERLEEQQPGLPLLVYGRLPPDCVEEARRRGTPLIHVRSAAELIRVASVQNALAVTVDPALVDGLSALKLLKVDGVNPDPIAWEARTRHEATPVFVVPLMGESEYAVVVAPRDAAFLESEEILPLRIALFRTYASLRQPPDGAN